MPENNVQDFWAQVRFQREALPAEPYFWLVSVASKDNARKGINPGVLSEVTRERAAYCLADGTHQLASAEQVAAYKAAEQAKRDNALDARNTQIILESMKKLQESAREIKPPVQGKPKEK